MADAGAPGWQPNGTLIVFAKAPRAGLVKTRMCPPLSPDQAADLYAEVLDDVLEASARFALDAGLEAVLCLHPAEACAEMAGRVPSVFRVIAQRGAGLAERMAWAIDEAIATGAGPVLLRGSDNPALSTAQLGEARRALDTHDVVVAPDLDGGYGLIGMRGSWSTIFDHPMSTKTVLEETLANAERLGLRVHLLEKGFDLDAIEDLGRLARAHARDELEACDRTLDWIRSNGFWPDD